MQGLEFLGVAERYPFERDPTTGGFKLISAPDILVQEFKIVLETPVGTIDYLEWFGSNLHLLKMKPNHKVLGSLLEYHSGRALIRCCPKCDFLDIVAKRVAEEQYNIGINYQPKGTVNEQWYVYPFYTETKQ
jgi:phage baseplate assembly protein W